MAGEGPGRVALIHSLAMTGDFWAPIIERLGGRAQILTIDCRGHGRSDKPAGPYTVELFAADLAAALDEAGWRDAVVGGASMGGSVALAFAGAYPERCAGLGLFDTTAWYGPDAPKDWEARAQKAVGDGLAAMAGFQTTRWFSDEFRARRPEVVQACIETFVANDVPAYVETCRMLGRADLRPLMARVSAPTRILVGEEDYATPVEMGRALHDGIAGSSFEVLPKARHLTPLEQPDRIAAELDRLLAGRVQPTGHSA